MFWCIVLHFGILLFVFTDFYFISACFVYIYMCVVKCFSFTVFVSVFVCLLICFVVLFRFHSIFCIYLLFMLCDCTLSNFLWKYMFIWGARVDQGVMSLDLTTHTSLSPIRRGFAPSFVNYKKGALDSQPQVIKFTCCLPRVGGSLRVLRLPPPLKLRQNIAEILLKVALNTKLHSFFSYANRFMCFR